VKIEAISIGHAPLAMRRAMRTASHATTHTENALVEIVADGLVGRRRFAITSESARTALLLGNCRVP
jgi:hypothetical protein